MMLFLELVKKELKENRIRMFILGAFVMGWQFTMLWRYPSWGINILGPIAVSTFFLLPVLMFILSLHSLHGEWKNKTFFLIGSFPVRFSTIVLAKLAAILVELFVYTLVACISLLYLFNQIKHDLIPPAYGGFSSVALLTRQIIFVLAFYLVVMLAAGAMANWSLIMGRVVSRFSWLLSMGMLFSGSWLVMRLTQLLSPIFNWIPHVIMVGQGSSAGIPQYYLSYIKPGPLLPILLVSLGLMLLAAHIFERYLEY